jgi:opacity protein-like surface antigen
MVLLFVTAMARPASADWLFTPYLGINFGGAANTVDINTLDEAFEQRANFGGSLAAMGGGIFGFEVDFNYTPNFFQLTEGDEDFEFFDVNSSMTTLMGSLVVGVPVGGQSGVGVRPYVTAGAGLMRANINFEDIFDDLSTNELGINFGGGLHIFFTDNIGFRGDVRYSARSSRETMTIRWKTMTSPTRISDSRISITGAPRSVSRSGSAAKP